jgi:hypothetical protein
MAKLRFKRIITPPARQPVFEDQGAQEARRMQREGLRDVVWVAIGLALILVVGLFYEWSQGSERHAQREKALAAARTQALPPASYQVPRRYPTAEEIQAEQVVREAREMAAANAAANASDPALNQQLAKPTAPAYSPVPPSPFAAQSAAPQTTPPVAAAPPAAAPHSAAPMGPPR